VYRRYVHSSICGFLMNSSIVRCRGTTPALSILCRPRRTCSQDCIRPRRRDGESVGRPAAYPTTTIDLLLAGRRSCLPRWCRDMARTISNTCCHERNKRSSRPVLPETESTKGSVSAMPWPPDCSAQSIVCDAFFTLTGRVLMHC
jgi:hypothetical protein